MPDYRAESTEKKVYRWKRSAFGQAVASHGEANRKCLQTQRRIRREPDASATWVISTAGSGSFLDLTGASCLFSSLALPGCSAELDSPLLFLDLLGAFSQRLAAGRKQQAVGQGCAYNSSGSPAAGTACWASTVSLTGVAVMGPEVGMGTMEGLPLFSFIPGPGALNLRDLESPGSLWPPWSDA